MNVAELLKTNLAAMTELAAAMPALAGPLSEATAMLETSIMAGGKLLCCGNGGSACDAAHFTAEIAGRYLLERKGYPAIDLTADHSILTALINDYLFPVSAIIGSTRQFTTGEAERRVERAQLE